MSQPPATAPAHGIHLPRYALVIFGLVAVLPWVALLYLGRDLMHPPAAAVNPAAAPALPVFHCQPGPWGDLQYNRIVIEPPESLIDLNEIRPRPIVWNFKGYTPDAVTTLWHGADLTPAQRQAIDTRRNWEVSADGVIIHPDTDFVLGLSPATRTRIYSVLSNFDENPDEKEPFRFRADATTEWFRNSELSEPTRALIERLLYRRGNSLLLSDTSIILATLPSSQERVRLVKTLARKSTLLVKLRVHPDTDFEALDDYWDRGRRTKDLKPLLQSLVRETDGIAIDIIHLLPRLPRSLLYTYPAVDEAGTNSFLDCHWTALNFFNLQPDEKFQHLEAVTATILNDYHLVTGRRTFGDILLFAKPDGTVIHSCVYVADEIVFTKNGSSQNSPWILMSLPDVVAYYPTDTPIDVQVYRAKDGIAEHRP